PSEKPPTVELPPEFDAVQFRRRLLGTPPDSPPPTARPPDDRYELLDELGRGGMGVVRRGRDRHLGRDLAIKILSAGLADDELRQRFLLEAQVSGRLQHPGVVPLYDLGELPDGRPFFAMKLVRGRTLAELLSEQPAPDRPRLLNVFLHV